MRAVFAAGFFSFLFLTSVVHLAGQLMPAGPPAAEHARWHELSVDPAGPETPVATDVRGARRWCRWSVPEKARQGKTRKESHQQPNQQPTQLPGVGLGGRGSTRADGRPAGPELTESRRQVGSAIPGLSQALRGKQSAVWLSWNSVCLRVFQPEEMLSKKPQLPVGRRTVRSAEFELLCHNGGPASRGTRCFSRLNVGGCVMPPQAG
jgi:hypothetical protein